MDNEEPQEMEPRFNGSPSEKTEFGPKLEEIKDPETLRNLVTALWGLLDDIDTLPDIMKPDSLENHERTLVAIIKRSETRHAYVLSDGYELFLPKGTT